MGAGMISNALNYLFQVYVGRALGPVEYGVFGALISILYIISVPSQTIMISVARYTSIYHKEDEVGKILYLVLKALKQITIAGLLAFIVIFLARDYIASFLKIPSSTPVIILGLIFLTGLLGPIINGALQGVQRFKSIGIAGILGTIFKLVFAIALIHIGLGVNGALLALALAGFGGIFVSLIFIYDILKSKPIKHKIKSLYKYSLPVLLGAFLLGLLSNLDMVLVKRLFDPHEAGYYAAISLLGKIIFFLTGSVVMVMFPKVSEKGFKNGDKKILRQSILLVLAISAAMLALYFTIPEFIVNALFGPKFISISDKIGFMGIGLALFSLINLLVYYEMAQGNTKFLYPLGIGVIAEVAIISLFHDNLFIVIYGFIAAQTLSLLLLGIQIRKLLIRIVIS